MGKFKQTEKDKKIINKAYIRGKVKNVIYFSKDKKNYAIIINKVFRLYAVRLILYAYEGDNDVKIIAVKRFPDLIGFYQKIEAIEKAEEIKKNQEVEQCKYEFETQEDHVENILIIGRTGGGKSTLANVISNTNEFAESAHSISKTKHFQAKVFEWKGIKYRILDTIGFADTKLSPNQILFRLAEAIYSMKGGIKQVLVTVGGRFTQEEIESFETLKAIFGKNDEKCAQDTKALKKDNRKISDLISSCNGIIYVNNPPLSDESNFLDNDESFKRRYIAKKYRNMSRKKLLEHLVTCKGTYKTEYWDKLCVKINDFMNAKEKLEENENNDLLIKGELGEITNEIIKEVKIIQSYPIVEEQIAESKATSFPFIPSEIRINTGTNMTTTEGKIMEYQVFQSDKEVVSIPSIPIRASEDPTIFSTQNSQNSETHNVDFDVKLEVYNEIPLHKITLNNNTKQRRKVQKIRSFNWICGFTIVCTSLFD
ncbi:33506_t:CDS:2, partial [Gigaspora margarita]